MLSVARSPRPMPLLPRRTPASTLRTVALLLQLAAALTGYAAVWSEQESPSGEYSARVKAADTKEKSGVQYPLSVTITTKLTKRVTEFPTEVSAVSKWVAVWDPKKDCFIFFAPQNDGWSTAFEPKAKYGPFTSRPLTKEERALGQQALDDKYGTHRPNDMTGPGPRR